MFFEVDMLVVLNLFSIWWWARAILRVISNKEYFMMHI